MAREFNASILQLDGAGGISPACSEDAFEATATRDSIGLCLSGGGSRALTCAMGQLRALHALGLIDQIFAISSVSGGTWANSLYMYLPASISDDDFLGTPVLDPHQITITGKPPYALDQLGPNSLGRVPGRLGVLRDLGEILKLKDRWGYPNSELWQGLIGHSVLRHFGLWQPDPAHGHFDRHFITWTDAYLKLPNGTLKRNPGLTGDDFYTVQHPRPFMVFNTALFNNNDASANLIPFEANFMVGIRQKFSGQQGAAIGGGFLESFAMAGAYSHDLKPGYVAVDPPGRRYTLADIAGSSSAAFAQNFEEQHPELSGLVPRYPYFPIANRSADDTRTYRFADGGNLENLGLNVMLARGIGRLLVGINTDETVRVEDGDIVVSSDLPPLFGFHPWVRGKGYVRYKDDPGTGRIRMFQHNKVFTEQAFGELQQALLSRKTAGVPLIYRQSLQVLKNDWYGVPAGQVDLLWMYNDFVKAFWQLLREDVRLAIDAAGLDQFPMYNTFTQLELGAIEVNALAHLWTWNLAAPWTAPGGTYSNADIVKNFFRG